MTVWLNIEKGELVVSNDHHELTADDWNVIETFLSETIDDDTSEDDDEGLRRTLGLEKEAS